MNDPASDSCSHTPAGTRSDPIPLERRKLLAGLLAVGSAGCSSSPSEETTSPTEDEGNGNGDSGESEFQESDADAKLESGGLYYVGQVLYRSEGISYPANPTLRESDGTFWRDVQVHPGGEVFLDTRGIPAGEYKLTTQDIEIEFTLIKQELSISFASQTVTGDIATLNIDSNRSSYKHNLEASVNGVKIAGAALQTALDGQGKLLDLDDDGQDEAVQVDGTSSQSISLNVSDFRNGMLRIKTTVPDTEVTASATTEIHPGRATLAIASKVVSGPRESIIEIPINLSNTVSATVVLGSEDLNYKVSMEIHDRNGDGEVIVQWDTGLAGQTNDPTDAFSTAGTQDELTNVSRSTPKLPGPLAVQAYPISLQVAGTETDVGTVTVTDPTAETTTEDSDGACTPGHTEGDPACEQVADDRKVLTRFEGDGTAVPVEILYPCGWNTPVSDFDDRIQMNATRSGIGDNNADVEVQVRAYYDAVEESIIQDIKSEGSYDEVEYEYDGETRTGLVSTADTAQYGTLGHAAVPFQDAFVHIELVSTFKDAACNIEPRPDYHLVKDMLKSVEPNPETTFADASDSF